MKRLFAPTFRISLSSVLFIPALLIGIWLELLLSILLFYQINKDAFITQFQMFLLFLIVLNGFAMWVFYRSLQNTHERFEQRMNYSIRPILLTDESFLWEMLDQSFTTPTNLSAAKFLRGIWEPLERNQYLKDWGRATDDGIVAVDQRNRQLIGAAWFRLLTGDEKGYGYVDDHTPELVIAVSPQYQDIELEMRLLIHLITVARKQFSSISLRVSSTKPGWRSYQLLGFRVISKTKTSIIMQTELNPIQSLR